MRRPKDAGVRRVSLDLPDPILESDIDRWTRTLQLSEAQAIALKAIWEGYRAQDDRLMEELVKPLWAQSAQAALCPPLECVDQMSDLYRERERVAQRLCDQEKPLFNALEELLAETQYPALTRVALARRRQQAQFSTFEHPGAGLDISDLMVMMPAISPSDPKAFDALCGAYEQSLTTLLESHLRAKWKAIDDGQRALADRQRVIDPATKQVLNGPTNPAARLRYQRLWDRVADLQKRILALNRLYVDLLSDLLPHDQGAMLRATFEYNAFPSAYPDPFSLDTVFAALAQAGLDDTTLVAIGAIEDSYSVRQQALTSELIDRTIEYTDSRLSRRSNKPGDFDVYKADMDLLQQARGEAAAETLSMLRGVLAPHELEAIQAQLAAREARISTHKPEARSTNFYRP